MNELKFVGKFGAAQVRASGLTAAGDFLSGFELFFRRERLGIPFSRSFAPKEGLQFRFPNVYGSRRVSFRNSKSSFTVKDREFDFPDLSLRKKVLSSVYPIFNGSRRVSFGI